MRSTFKVLFYLKKNNPQPNGKVPVMGRITVNGTIAQFSCKIKSSAKASNKAFCRKRKKGLNYGNPLPFAIHAFRKITDASPKVQGYTSACGGLAS